MWHYDDGAYSFPFAPDGRPYPDLPSSFTWTVTRMRDGTFDYVEEGYGRALERHHQELTPDGQTLTERVNPHLPGLAVKSRWPHVLRCALATRPRKR
ncbi:MAG TPA: hypothetical protein VMR62_04135 [Bryobacteraceae bacterium]|jgi:hypothetical protein|nr:hypothetical protein [Bryobacteraceae bacterium]